jgi:hypothetical protein
MRILFALVCLFIAAPVFAQTNPVPAGQPFNVDFDHDGQNVTGFQCVLDGKPLGAVLPATARRCAIAGLAAGPHTVAVEAVNAFGATASQPLSATAGTAPQAPTNLRIVVQVAVQSNGDVTLLSASVSKE